MPTLQLNNECQTPRKLSKAIQVAPHYTLVLRSQGVKLSVYDNQLMNDAILPNEELAWERTSNFKVVKSNSKYMIQLLHRNRVADKKGVRKYSSEYNRDIDAENDAFNSRYNLESKSFRQKIDRYKLNLKETIGGEASITPSVSVSVPESLELTTTLKRKRNFGFDHRRSYAMSSNKLLNHKAKSFRNPNNYLPSLFQFHSVAYDTYAIKIQHIFRNRCVRYSAKRKRQTMKDQAYRMYIISYLTAYIESDTCYKLLLGFDDDEVALSFSPYEKKHVHLKSIHIADAIKNLVRHTVCE